ncbi:hypothetical protein [Megalodesulfovibrio paquesii]
MIINTQTIWHELDSAGLSGLFNRLSIGSDGAILGDLTNDERAAVQAVLDAHDPTPLTPAPRILSRVQFLGRLTPQEWAAAVTSPVPEVMYFVELVRAASEIDLDDAQTQAGLQVAVQAGVLESWRTAQVLA